MQFKFFGSITGTTSFVKMSQPSERVHGGIGTCGVLEKMMLYYMLVVI